MKRKVLVIGPHRNTRGGITSVIKAYENTSMWKEWGCVWIATYIDRNALIKILFFFKGLVQFIFNIHKASIVHIHFSEPTSALRKNIFMVLAKKLGKPVIIHFHAFSPDTTIFSKKKARYLKMFNSANLVIVLSNFWKQQVETMFYDSEKVKVLYNPCPNIVRTTNDKKENQILFAGTLNKRKGYADLLKAFSKIASKYPGWKLVFAGNGEIDNATTICNQLNITSQVEFKGWVAGEEKNKLFNSASVFCLPSYAEGFPMAVLDAWAFGLPVITTPVGGLPDVLLHKENALVFEPGDIDSLAQNLLLLISDNELRNKLSIASTQLSRQKFHIDTISKQLNELYQSIN